MTGGYSGKEYHDLDVVVKKNRQELAQIEKMLASNNIELEMNKDKLENLELDNFSLQRERDLLRLRNEKYLTLLRLNGIDPEVGGNEENKEDMEMSDQPKDEFYDEMGILDEYRNKVKFLED
jgi:hypothetical protein